MDFNAIRPDGPTIAIEHQATGETPVHVTPEGIQPAAQAAVPETDLNLKAAYDDLVKRLRKEASYWCTNCCYRAGDCNCFAPDDRKKDCDVYTKLQAADAIEELQDAVQAQDKALKLCADQLARHWTPVTERLPDCEWGAEVGNIEWISYGMVSAGCFGRGGKYRDAYFRTWTDGTEGIDAKDADYWRPIQIPEPPKEAKA